MKQQRMRQTLMSFPSCLSWWLCYVGVVGDGRACVFPGRRSAPAHAIPHVNQDILVKMKSHR